MRNASSAYRVSSASRQLLTAVVPPDIAASLAEWFGLPFDESPLAAGKSWLKLILGEAESIRDRACVVSQGGEQAIRTAGWYMRQSRPNEDTLDPPAELYARPDDQHEINEISSLRSGVVRSMRQALGDWLSHSHQNASLLPPLEPEVAAAFHD